MVSEPVIAGRLGHDGRHPDRADHLRPHPALARRRRWSVHHHTGNDTHAVVVTNPVDNTTVDDDHATAVTVSLVLQDGLITLDITDDGRGLGTPTRSSGLSSMRRRAELNGGTFQLTTPATGGTHLAWTARPKLVTPRPKGPDAGK